MNNLNPFRENRAEQMQDLWKLYVPFPQLNNSLKPMVVEGGRGSGKTMFFLCNSWREKLKILKSEEKKFNDILEHPNFIGIYYRVDTAFVTAMHDMGDTTWNGIFNTYLGVCIAKDIMCFLRHTLKEGAITENELLPTLMQVANQFKEGAQVNNIYDAQCLCEQTLDYIQDIINEPTDEVRFRKTVIGRIVTVFIENLKQINIFKDTVFKIFIDEYETLLEWQQTIINTLIKHSDKDIVYNIGMRPKGMKTSKAFGSTEVIQSPHDFTLFRLDIKCDDNDKNSKSDYEKFIKEICSRRIQLLKDKGQLPTNVPTDIEFYLGHYDMDDELNQIINSSRRPAFISRLDKIIECSVQDKVKSDEYIRVLSHDANIINARLHLAILLRSTHYRPTVHRLYTIYLGWLNGADNEYKDWLHNAKYGLVFLLDRDFNKKKLYYGFNAYMMLSSGVIRYFLELCEQAIDFALLDGFIWASPKTISPTQQTKAARYVSRYKILDIEGYEPYGKNLRIFVQYLGEIFRDLHRNPNNSLGEPEPNHFYTNNFSIDSDLRKIINSAIMWNVLQEEEPTKEKITDLPTESLDYFLNRIYLPYFEVSYRKKRKILINQKQLKNLFSGNEEAAKGTAKAILDEKWKKSEMYLKKIFGITDFSQITFFDGDEHND